MTERGSSPEQLSEQEKKPSGISRRDFLSRSLFVGGLVAFSGTLMDIANMSQKWQRQVNDNYAQTLTAEDRQAARDQIRSSLENIENRLNTENSVGPSDIDVENLREARKMLEEDALTVESRDNYYHTLLNRDRGSVYLVTVASGMIAEALALPGLVE